jgi:hypothetical protein
LTAPVAFVGWHGCVGVGCSLAPQGGNWLRLTGVEPFGLHGLSFVGI